MLLLLIFFLIEFIAVSRWLLRRNKNAKNKIEAHPHLPKEIVTEILRYTFYFKGPRYEQVAVLHCTEVCKQWKQVIEQDLAHEWLNRIRSASDNEESQIEEAIKKWSGVLKLAPKQMSYLLRRRLAILINRGYGGSRPHRRRAPDPIALQDIGYLPNMEMSRLPSWQVWHSGTRDPFEPIKYLKTCIFEPEWFTLLYTRQKKKFLSVMETNTVSRGGYNYAWWFLLLHLPYLESLVTLWILAWRRGNFLTNLWIPEDDLVSWQTTIYFFVNFLAFVSMEISIGVWGILPVRLSSAICFGILAYGIKYILKSVLLMTLAYAIGGIYYTIARDRSWPISELMAVFAFILVYPVLGIMLAICYLGFPWEERPRKYFFVGLGLLFFSYLFYDSSINFWRLLL